MKTMLEYWDKINNTSCYSEIKKQEEINGSTEIEIFEKFYKKNNNLRYCNGSYYKFHSKKWENKYNNWLNSNDYKNNQQLMSKRVQLLQLSFGKYFALFLHLGLDIDALHQPFPLP